MQDLQKADRNDVLSNGEINMHGQVLEDDMNVDMACCFEV